jgi:hypothetical protein
VYEYPNDLSRKIYLLIEHLSGPASYGQQIPGRANPDMEIKPPRPPVIEPALNGQVSEEVSVNLDWKLISTTFHFVHCMSDM